MQSHKMLFLLAAGMHTATTVLHDSLGIPCMADLYLAAPLLLMQHHELQHKRTLELTACIEMLYLQDFAECICAQLCTVLVAE